MVGHHNTQNVSTEESLDTIKTVIAKRKDGHTRYRFGVKRKECGINIIGAKINATEQLQWLVM